MHSSVLSGLALLSLPQFAVVVLGSLDSNLETSEAVFQIFIGVVTAWRMMMLLLHGFRCVVTIFDTQARLPISQRQQLQRTCLLNLLSPSCLNAVKSETVRLFRLRLLSKPRRLFHVKVGVGLELFFPLEGRIFVQEFRVRFERADMFFFLEGLLFHWIAKTYHLVLTSLRPASIILDFSSYYVETLEFCEARRFLICLTV